MADPQDDIEALGPVYLPWFLLLAALFCFRVLAQLAQWIHPTGLLPPFAAWHSETLPYWLLLVSQIAIIAAMAYVVVRVRNGGLRPSPVLATGLFWFGAAYFAGMAFRLVAGQTFLSHIAWFAAPLPAFFHLVLAGFVMLLGRYHSARLHLARAIRAP